MSQQFNLNIQCSVNENIVIKHKRYPEIIFDANLKIGLLKLLIKIERKMYKSKIYLEYKDEIMEDEKCLKDYDISNDKHLIRMKIAVEESNNKPTTKSQNNGYLLINDKEKESIIKLNKQVNKFKQLYKSLNNHSKLFNINKDTLIKQIKDNIKSLIDFLKNKEKELISIIKSK